MGSASDTISQCRDPQSRSSDRTELRVRGRRTLLALGSAGVALLVLLDWGLGFPVRFPGTRTNGLAKGKPTIVLILTDDQRWDTLSAMPNLQRLLVAHGVEFTQSFVVDPLCCPSRASLLTGTYPSSTGVWADAPPYGGFPAFRDRSTLATWLHHAGYRTALFGKYLNRYEDTRYVPPGWDRWVAFDGARRRDDFYYRYGLNVDGRIVRRGSRPEDYSTNVIAGEADSFIRSTSGPLFVYFAPFGPHPPSKPDPKDAGRFRGIKPWRPPSYNEGDVSKEPGWVRALNPISPKRQASIDGLRERMIESLQAVDRAVARIVEALAATGRLGRAMIVFASDNGYSWGEHRWDRKAAPWEEDIRVPLVIRYDPMVRSPRTDEHLVANIDYAPTFAEVARASAPGVQGRSLIPLLRTAGPVGWRVEVGLEAMRDGRMPGYCGVRTTRYAFVEYTTSDSQLYLIQADPLELSNLAADPSRSGLVSMLAAHVRRLCKPPPPGSPAGFPP